jgi:two-component system chemotaxis response regulator CheB
MTLKGNADLATIRLDQSEPENSCRPAVDVLFRSVAAVYGPATLAVVLTGMGQDGLCGCEAVRKAGGRVVAQDEATSTVWGMPGAIVGAGLADEIVSLEQMAAELNLLARQRRFRGQPSLAASASA